MNVTKMIAELRQERELDEQAILSLERIARASGRRRGRPPKWMSAPQAGSEQAILEKPKRRFSEETRRKMALAQEKRWAAQKS